MKLVCDADGLIKLNRAEILNVLIESVDVLVGQKVFHEAVTEGKERNYPDAFEIEAILEQSNVNVPRAENLEEMDVLGTELGFGERGALSLCLTGKADAIVSDDRRFLGALEAQVLRFLTPAAALVMLAEEDLLQLDKAYEALENLKSMTRIDHSQAALTDLAKKERGEP